VPARIGTRSPLIFRPFAHTFRPKITDFGVTKCVAGDGEAPGLRGSTVTGELLGTPQYMAPEQATGLRQAVGPAADVYALGAILYELLTGRPSFTGETPLDTVLQVDSCYSTWVGQLDMQTDAIRPEQDRIHWTLCRYRIPSSNGSGFLDFRQRATARQGMTDESMPADDWPGSLELAAAGLPLGSARHCRAGQWSTLRGHERGRALNRPLPVSTSGNLLIHGSGVALEFTEACNVRTRCSCQTGVCDTCECGLIDI
jgi:serine/threonine protein kinase